METMTMSCDSAGRAGTFGGGERWILDGCGVERVVLRDAEDIVHYGRALLLPGLVVCGRCLRRGLDRCLMISSNGHPVARCVTCRRLALQSAARRGRAERMGGR